MTFLFGKKRAVTPLPAPLKRWFADPACVERLRDILADPVFQVACATLQNQAQPSSAVVGADTVANNNRLQWLAGYNDFTRDLVSLTRYPQDTESTPTPEWDYLTKPTDETYE